MRAILLIFSLGCFVPLFGQEKDSLSLLEIDVWLETCLENDSNQTTIGMLQCTDYATELWTTELNKYLNQLEKVLSDQEKSKLKLSQAAWVNYLNSEKDFSTSFFHQRGGAVWRVIGQSKHLQIVRIRTLELREYYETLLDVNQEE